MRDSGAAAGADLARRLAAGDVIVLDGATGTELERRGAKTALPLWSTAALIDCPELVRAIHADYAAAGADLLTANTFRTQRRTLARCGLADRAADLTRRAVELAREGARAAARDRAPLLLGSAPTLEDCYRPDLVPSASQLEREHALHAENLAAAGVDAILVETMNTAREALAALRAARATGLPSLVSFVCGAGGRLLSGEGLSEALEAIRGEEPLAVLVNCLPPAHVPACLPLLRESGLPFGAYPNLGEPNDETGFTRSHDCPAEELARLTRDWVASGARIVGGCCGTTPDHIRAIATELRN